MSYSYNGTQCPGVFEGISLKSSNATSIIDVNIFAYMSVLNNADAPWLYTTCTEKIRHHVCMLQLGLYPGYPYPYLAVGDITYCQNSCFALFADGSVCKPFFDIIDSTTVSQMMYVCNFLKSGNSCTDGNSSTYTELPPVCPLPLVVPDSESWLSDHVELIDGTACALPCPSLIFTDEDWKYFKELYVGMYVVSVVLSLITIIHCAQVGSLTHTLSRLSNGPSPFFVISLSTSLFIISRDRIIRRISIS